MAALLPRTSPDDGCGSMAADEGESVRSANPRGAWCVYVLRCRGNYLYIGSTNDLSRRLSEHENGTGSKFVRSRRPFELAKVISCTTGREARQLEYRLKKLRRKAKVAFLSLDE